MNAEQVQPGEEWSSEAALLPDPPPNWRCVKHGATHSAMVVTTDIGTDAELETTYCLHCLREVLDAKIGRMVPV